MQEALIERSLRVEGTQVLRTVTEYLPRLSKAEAGSSSRRYSRWWRLANSGLVDGELGDYHSQE